MRGLSDKFMEDLKKGVLVPILERLKKDDTLMLAIRTGYVNIYYRGGNLLKISECSPGCYAAFFDIKYDLYGSKPSLPSAPISSAAMANEWVKTFPLLKTLMDEFLSLNPKAEREFQQLVARENNFSPVSNESEYFIADIESADASLGARFDMLAVRWLAHQRKNGSNCRLAFVEMKYGDGALGGKSGLVEHLRDIQKFVSDEGKYHELLKGVENQFRQLDELGLLKFNKSREHVLPALSKHDKPELIMLLANHNPRSSKLKSIITGDNFLECAGSHAFDLRFFVAKFAGYSMHSNCIYDLEQFTELV